MSTAPTTTSDPQTWVFPPPGAPSPPVAETSNFGPVHLGDSIVLDWMPSTFATVILTCLSIAGEETAIYVAQNANPPLSHIFNDRARQTSPTDDTFCHFYFMDTDLGNTVVWRFFNNASDPAATWKPPSNDRAATTTLLPAPTATANAAASSTASISASTLTSEVASSAAATTPPPSASAEDVSGGLSPGASAGVGVSAGIAVLALASAGVVLFLRRRWKKKEEELVKSRDGVVGFRGAEEGENETAAEEQVLGGMKSPRSELNGRGVHLCPMELGAGNVVGEMEAGGKMMPRELGGEKVR